jgi:hypothetical protein
MAAGAGRALAVASTARQQHHRPRTAFERLRKNNAKRLEYSSWQIKRASQKTPAA